MDINRANLLFVSISKDKVMIDFRRFIVIFLVLVISGCQTFSYEQAQPAVLKNNSQSIQEITRIINEALYVKNVKLSQNAFQREHWLAIDKVGVKEINNGLILGRQSERPKRFQLLIFNEHCFLYQHSAKFYWKLKQTQCKLKDD
jgi:hypothetical protein